MLIFKKKFQNLDGGGTIRSTLHHRQKIEATSILRSLKLTCTRSVLLTSTPRGASIALQGSSELKNREQGEREESKGGTKIGDVIYGRYLMLTSLSSLFPWHTKHIVILASIRNM